MPDNLRRQAAARSPLLQQLLARGASQGPVDFRGQHPLAAAMYGIGQGLERRALRKAEGERQKQQDSASEALQRAIAGTPDTTLALPESTDDLSYGQPPTIAGQQPGTPNDILAAALNPALSQQQAGIGLQVAQSQLAAKAAADKAAAEAAAKAAEAKAKAEAPIKLSKNDRLVNAKGEEIVGPVPDTAIQRMNLGKGVVVSFDPVTGENEVLRIDLPKDMELTGHMASQEEKQAMGLSGNESYWIDADGKPIKVAGTTEVKAARIAQLEVGRNAWSKARELLFDNEGGLNSAAVAAARKNVPVSGGRTIRGLAVTALDAYLRATSGAAVPETEVERAFEAFFPSFAQPAEDAKRRMDMLDKFLSGSQELLVPSSASSEEKVAAVKAHVDKMVLASGSSETLSDEDLVKKWLPKPGRE